MQDKKMSFVNDSRRLSPSEMKIEEDFKVIHNRLRKIEKKYNPNDDNLHFDSIQKPDPKLFTELLDLTHDGLKKVRLNSDFFLKNSLYADNFFWYELFLIISSASLGVMKSKTQHEIPVRIVESLIDNLIIVDPKIRTV